MIIWRKVDDFKWVFYLRNINLVYDIWWLYKKGNLYCFSNLDSFVFKVNVILILEDFVFLFWEKLIVNWGFYI